MAIRIEEPNVFNTERLMEQVLVPMIRDGQRVSFLCEPGTGKRIVQRLRVMMSRKRKALLAKQKKVKRFTMRHSIHPETHDGKRHDCVILWQQVGETHFMSEELEDILSHG
jgi:hypothetical protein